MSLFGSFKNIDNHKVITILGIKIKINLYLWRSFMGYKSPFRIPFGVAIRYKSFLPRVEFFAHYCRRPNYDFNGDKFESDYNKLTAGLDDASLSNVNNVVSIYKKYQELFNKKSISAKELGEYISLINPTEEELTAVERDCYSKINVINSNEYQFGMYKLPINHFESSVFYHRHSIDVLNSLSVIKEKCIIDVGGFIGDSALVFSPYTNKKIYSFEASPENFYLMQKTIAMNDLKNVIPVQLALGANVDEKLYLSGAGSCTVIDSKKEQSKSSLFAINSTTLDDYVKKNNLDVGLIKVDIEGYEQEFLKGAENTIKSQKPALLISIYHKPEDYLYIKPIIESWNLGYKFRIICPPENRLFETLLIAEVY